MGKFRRLQIGILILLICFVVAVSGCINTNNSANTSSSNNSTISSGNGTNNGDVNVQIQYSGSWACDVSGTFGFRSLSGTGDQTTDIGQVTGALTAAARKTDNGNGMLTVTIIRNGKTLASQSTSAPYGGATAVATGL